MEPLLIPDIHVSHMLETPEKRVRSATISPMSSLATRDRYVASPPFYSSMTRMAKPPLSIARP
jgi:hypothetical protein